jgi:starch phosphorylase
LWAEACGAKFWHGDLDQAKTRISQIPDAAIWSMRTAAREALVAYIRKCYSRQVAVQGASGGEIAAAAAIFDSASLTLGFARRFAAYKRPTLLLHDPERLLRILHNQERPVQLVIAGKAHPNDAQGQDMIRQWTDFIRRRGANSPVVFLSDYDMSMTGQLVGGVDLWINTPRRPWEASGTSGMKVLVNGGLNLSELDGWWVEAYGPDVGWAIGDGLEHGADPEQDAAEAAALYSALEHEIIPEFYQRSETGIPLKWVARIRESMARLTPQYSANRAVREYTESHYIPAAAAYLARAEQGGKLGAEVHAWQQGLATGWNGAAFGSLTAESKEGRIDFAIPVYFGGLDPEAVRVELFADGGNAEAPVRIPMERGAPLPGNGFLYAARIEGSRRASDFTPRLVPYHPSAAVPLEAGQILWQK